MAAAALVGCGLLQVGTAGTARADAAPGPGLVCPPHTVPRYHAGEYCAPESCGADSDCGRDGKCFERALGLGDREPGAEERHYEQEGNCEGGAACPLGSVCVKDRFCGEPAPAHTEHPPEPHGEAAAGPVPPVAPKHGCGCEVPGGASWAADTALVALGLAAALGALAWRRRK